MARRRRKTAAGLSGNLFVEGLAGDHLEQIAALEALFRMADEVGVFARLVVAEARGRLGLGEGARLAAARSALRRIIVFGEDITVAESHDRVVIDHHHLVGQEQHHVALIFRPFQLQIDRVELKGEVITKGAIEAEIGISSYGKRR